MAMPVFTPASESSAAALRDPLGRALDYLRLSITDRCNLRCAYCLPAEPGCRNGKGAEASPREAPPRRPGPGPGQGGRLTRGQILLLAGVAAGLGVRKLRLTGGEPLLRRGLPGLVADLAALPGLERVALTTNGLLLARWAAPLRAAGLAAVNVSLDTLRPERFAALTGADRLRDVLAGIEAALAAGLAVKVNSIVLPGFNDDELPALAGLAAGAPLAVRFIAHVPAPGREGDLARLGMRSGPSPAAAELERRLGQLLRLEPVPRSDLAGPAREWRIDGGRGRVGIIDVRRRGLCADCNRLRVTATGQVRGCLFQPAGIELGPLLRAGDRDGLARALRAAAAAKPAGHGMAPGGIRLPARMSEIGG